MDSVVVDTLVTVRPSQAAQVAELFFALTVTAALVILGFHFSKE